MKSLFSNDGFFAALIIHSTYQNIHSCDLIFAVDKSYRANIILPQISITFSSDIISSSSSMIIPEPFEKTTFVGGKHYFMYFTVSVTNCQAS